MSFDELMDNEALRIRDEHIEKLESRVVELTDECRAKDARIAELEKWQQKLITANNNLGAEIDERQRECNKLLLESCEHQGRIAELESHITNIQIMNRSLIDKNHKMSAQIIELEETCQRFADDLVNQDNY